MRFIEEGVFFNESSCGTNAIDLAIQLNKAIYTYPEHHYCQFLKHVYIYSKPFSIRTLQCYQISIFSYDMPIEGEWMAIVELISQCLRKPLDHVEDLKNKYQTSNNICLRPKQIEILILIGQGLTDKAIAIERGISIDTVKYHKKKIFTSLNVSCSLQAVIEALKKGIIVLDQLAH